MELVWDAHRRAILEMHRIVPDRVLKTQVKSDTQLFQGVPYRPYD